MKIEALKSIIEFDGGQMVVINAGETGDLSDAKAQTRIAAGEAIHAGEPLNISDAEREALPQLDHDGDGDAGGSVSGGAGDDIKAVRAEYEALLGKRPFPGWDIEELQRRIAEASPVATAEVIAADDDSEGGDAFAPPVD